MITVLFQNRKYKFESRKTIKAVDLLNKMNINPEIILISKNGKIVTEEDFIENNDKIELLKIISGG